PADLGDVALSPDGSRVAVSVLDVQVGTRDIWTYDVTRGIGQRITSDPGDDLGPNWGRPDGAQILFSSRPQGAVHVYEIAANGSGGERLLWSDGLGKFNPTSSTDGRFAMYVGGGGIINRSELWVLPLGPGQERKAFPFLQASYVHTQGQFSPDG